jgi:ribosome-binding factor A
LVGVLKELLVPKTFHRTDRVSSCAVNSAPWCNAVREHGPSVMSDVEITRDMAHAKVFVTALMPERSAEAVAGLKNWATACAWTWPAR